MKRRDFVKQTTLASSLVMVPSFLKAFDDTFNLVNSYKRVVVIQLTGGNDGLNTIIPYRNDIYYKSRPQIAIDKNSVLRATDDLGFHESMGQFKQLYDQGYVSIINNVGYPNPNRSHFRSTDIWQTASNANQYLQTGWIGRYLDAYGQQPYNAVEVDESLSLIMKGAKMNGIATNDAKRLYRTSQEPYFKKLLQHYEASHLSEHNLGYLYKTMVDAESSARYIYETSRTFNSKQNYPKTNFGKQLKTTAEFINSGLKTKVYYASLNGFDTHATQPNRQSRLLKTYSEAIYSFVEDLKKNNTFKDTLILTFSEFGRRVEQNAANGTDHGAANNVFVITGNLKSRGFYNNLDTLEDLDTNGDIKYELDFRHIYATILDNWLGVEHKSILNYKFKKLDFI